MNHRAFKGVTYTELRPVVIFRWIQRYADVRKKRFVATTLLLLTTGTSFTGCQHNMIDNTDMIQIENRKSTAINYIDMNRVTEYSGTDTGLQLYFEDGTGYYLEVPQRQEGMTEIYYIFTQEDLECLSHALENRNEKIIIEVSNGTVLDSEGNGIDTLGYDRGLL